MSYGEHGTGKAKDTPTLPLDWGVFRGVAHAAWGGAIEHENYSPPLEGCRGGLSPTGRPTPKADAFCPSQEGIFRGVSHAAQGGVTAHEEVGPSRDRKRVVEVICAPP